MEKSLMGRSLHPGAMRGRKQEKDRSLLHAKSVYFDKDDDDEEMVEKNSEEQALEDKWAEASKFMMSNAFVSKFMVEESMHGGERKSKHAENRNDRAEKLIVRKKTEKVRKGQKFLKNPK